MQRMGLRTPHHKRGPELQTRPEPARVDKGGNQGRKGSRGGGRAGQPQPPVALPRHTPGRHLGACGARGSEHVAQNKPRSSDSQQIPPAPWLLSAVMILKKRNAFCPKAVWTKGSKFTVTSFSISKIIFCQDIQFTGSVKIFGRRLIQTDTKYNLKKNSKKKKLFYNMENLPFHQL